MWPFKKTSSSKQGPTLKKRVVEFWKWFEANAARFHATIEDKRCGDLSDEVSEAVDRWFPDMAWVFGSGANGVGHSFTMTGEGVLPKQFVAEYWLKLAPKIEEWIFYSSRQASGEDPVFSITMDDTGDAFRPIEFWIFPYVDEHKEKIDISVWHPSIGRVAERDRFMALFLMLDELLGEHGTQRWIGEIKFSGTQLKDSIPIAELVELVGEIQSKHGWKQFPPTECYTSYQLKEHTTDWLRGDTVAGTARYRDLIGAYLDAKGPCKHPLPGSGVDFVFVSIEKSHFPKGEEVNGRNKIEDEIGERLVSSSSGISLGGATGLKNCYIDFALYDGEESLEMIRSILRACRVPKTSLIHFFTDDFGKRAIPV